MIYKIIQELKSTRSRNEKEAILLKNSDNTELKVFFELALSPFINFFQKKPFKQEFTGSAPLLESMSWLRNVIADRKITGNTAIIKIQQCIDWSSEDDAKVIMHILQKESGADLGASTINKIWPKLIPTFPCQLATAYDEKLALKLDWFKGVISQLKSDGLRLAIVIDEEGDVKAFSRAGNELNVFGKFDVLGTHFKSVVLDGELLTINKDTLKFNNRQTSNGICSKAIKGTMSQAEADMLHVVVWDVIPYTDFKKESSDIQYKTRLETLQKMISDVHQHADIISIIPTRIVHSIEQAQEHYQEMLAAGEEGTMLKSFDVLWGDTRSKLILKLKSEFTADMEVVGYKAGEGRLVGNLGSLDIATSDRKVFANMSGFSLKLRCEILANLTNSPVPYTMIEDGKEVQYIASPNDVDIGIGSIIEVMYNQKIKARDSDTWSLFLPRFKQSRQDKLIANTLEELK